MKFKRIFITGGAGFIGANLVKHLLDNVKGDITVYDNFSIGTHGNLKKAIEESKERGPVRTVKGDLLDAARLNRSIRGHDIVVHLAAHTNVQESIKDPKKNFAVNSTGTFNLLEASKRGVNKFIFASSNAVIGNGPMPVNETALPKPITPYGANKLFGEALCAAYYRSYNLNTVSLRFSNVYGPYSNHKRSVVAAFIDRTMRGRPIEIYGDGTQTRDFINVKDVCRAVELFIKTPLRRKGVWGGVFHIGTGTETRIIDLAEIINGFSGSRSLGRGRIIFKRRRKGDILRNYSDPKKLKKALGFKAVITLKEGLKETFFAGYDDRNYGAEA